MLVVKCDWSFAHHTAPVVTTTSIILSNNKIHNRDILVLANPGSQEKWPLKRRQTMMMTTYEYVPWLLSIFYYRCHRGSVFISVSLFVSRITQKLLNHNFTKFCGKMADGQWKKNY